jgi:hypothetical protein
MRAAIIAGLGILVLVAVALFAAPAVELSPKNNTSTTDRKPLLRWQGGGTTVYLDDNPDFTSPEVIRAPKRAAQPTEDLAFKTYYWKVPPSPVWQFTVEGNVQVSIPEPELLKNDGNTVVEVAKNRQGGITGAIVAVGAIEDISNAKEVEVRQHE